MYSKKDVVIFFAGAEAFHTLSHAIFFFFLSSLSPIAFWGITLTPQLNVGLMVINAIITVGLLMWASRLSCCYDI